MKRRSPSVPRVTQQHRRASTPSQTVRAIYRTLSQAWGPQHWWPAETPFEVIVGAILTQNTSWTNVERALANLHAVDALSLERIRLLPLDRLEQLIRPSGYFRQKARRLKDFINFLDTNHGGSLEVLLSTPVVELRNQLLAQKGIGPETADSILLYAAHHPVFVVDAYTRRVLERHDAITAAAKYDELRTLVEQALLDEISSPNETLPALNPTRPAAHSPSTMSTAKRPPQVQIYNEMHGLFVQLGKHFCAKHEPKCNVCPLGAMLSRPVQTTSSRKSRRPASNSNRRASKHPTKPRV